MDGEAVMGLREGPVEGEVVGFREGPVEIGVVGFREGPVEGVVVGLREGPGEGVVDGYAVNIFQLSQDMGRMLISSPHQVEGNLQLQLLQKSIKKKPRCR